MAKEKFVPIWIANYSIQVKKDLVNIAKNSGYPTLTGYLRTLIFKAIADAPEHLKRDWKDKPE